MKKLRVLMMFLCILTGVGLAGEIDVCMIDTYVSFTRYVLACEINQYEIISGAIEWEWTLFF